MNDIHYKYWSFEDRLSLSKAKTFVDLAILAISIIQRMPKGVQMVSGPITTGGFKDIDQNRRVFEKVIEILSERGVNIFSQMPFEEKIVELAKIWQAENPEEEYCMPILNDFYEAVFSSGLVSDLNFIFDWESSFGAKWENSNCKRWGINANYLPRELSLEALRKP